MQFVTVCPGWRMGVATAYAQYKNTSDIHGCSLNAYVVALPWTSHSVTIVWLWRVETTHEWVSTANTYLVRKDGIDGWQTWFSTNHFHSGMLHCHISRSELAYSGRQSLNFDNYSTIRTIQTTTKKNSTLELYVEPILSLLNYYLSLIYSINI